MTNTSTSTNNHHRDPQAQLVARIRRQVISELASSAGLNPGRVAIEVLYLMPTEFTDAYTTLFYEALKDPAQAPRYGESDEGTEAGNGTTPSSKKPKTRKGKGKRGGVEAFTGSHGAGKRYKTHWVIRSEKALRRKQRIDAKLRELAYQMLHDTAEDKAGQCPECHKFLQANWRFCPGCGQPTAKR